MWPARRRASTHPAMELTLREGTIRDLPFLREMLYEAAF